MSTPTVSYLHIEINQTEISEIKERINSIPGVGTINTITIEDPLIVKASLQKDIQTRSIFFCLVGGMALGLGAAILLTNPLGWAIGLSALLFLGGMALIYERIKIEARDGAASFPTLLLPAVVGVLIGGLLLAASPIIVPPMVLAAVLISIIIAWETRLEMPIYDASLTLGTSNGSKEIKFRLDQSNEQGNYYLEKKSVTAYIQEIRNKQV